MTTVAQHLVEALVNAGVQRVYDIVGDSLDDIVNAGVGAMSCGSEDGQS
jgi:thiamine pyrophosphate-dependent acetolactate synthase large subunit-like protein